MNRPGSDLQYYSDGSFGYKRWDEEEKLQAGLEVLEEQREDEKSADFFDRIGIAPRKNMYGYRFLTDMLAYDSDPDMRKKVAASGYCLDKLIDDKVWFVRAEVAKQGYGLDKLINDENELVREAAAEAAEKYGIEI